MIGLDKTKIIRPTLLTIAVYTFLLWAYVALRIITQPSIEADAFIDGIPICIWHTGVLAFIMSAVSAWAYLILREGKR